VPWLFWTVSRRAVKASSLGLGVSIVKINRDGDQDFSRRWDLLFSCVWVQSVRAILDSLKTRSESVKTRDGGPNSWEQLTLRSRFLEKYFFHESGRRLKYYISALTILDSALTIPNSVMTSSESIESRLDSRDQILPCGDFWVSVKAKFYPVEFFLTAPILIAKVSRLQFYRVETFSTKLNFCLDLDIAWLLRKVHA
jgi:hypothetical protein